MERSKRARRGQIYASWQKEAESADESSTKRRKTKDQGGEVDCSCGVTTYDSSDPRPMVECENCLNWQHIECASNGSGESGLPDPYKCFRCEAGQDGVSGEEHEEIELPKVRQSVVTALEQIFVKQLIPLAQSEKLLAADLPAEYAHKLAREIEAALFEAHADKKTEDPGQKYRERFRTLSFNLKDNKNNLLQTQIITKQVSPQALAALSADEMLSPELRKLADQVKQESIQGSILKVDDGPRVRKTHKGEELVENEDKEPVANEDAPLSPETEEQPIEEPKRRGSSISGEAQYGNVDTFEELEFSPVSPHESDDDDFAQTISSNKAPQIWKGKIFAKNLPEFEATAVHVSSGRWTSGDWNRAFDTSAGQLELKGRIDQKVGAEYLEKISESRVLGIFALEGDLEELFNYYKSRDKYAVIASSSSIVKDSYLIPFTIGDTLPSWLAPGESILESIGTNLLIGVYVLPSENVLY